MKRMVAVFVLFAAILSLLPLSVGAEDKMISYGADSLTLRVIDTFAEDDFVAAGWENLGKATIKDGKILIESSLNMYDAYNIKTGAIDDADWSGMRYMVLAVDNTSDGDVYFCLQPANAAGGNLYTSAALAADDPVYLYNTEKEEVTAAKWSRTQAVNNRDAFIIPWKFNGYIFIPLATLADISTLAQPAMPEGGAICAYGFHTVPDDATYVELTIAGIYACGDMPVFHAAEKTADDTVAAEEPSAEKTDTAAEAGDEEPSAGSLYLVGICAAVLAILLVLIVLWMRKRQNKKRSS